MLNWERKGIKIVLDGFFARCKQDDEVNGRRVAEWEKELLMIDKLAVEWKKCFENFQTLF